MMEYRTVEGYDWKMHTPIWIVECKSGFSTRQYRISANYYVFKESVVEFMGIWDNENEAVVATFPRKRVLAIWDEKAFNEPKYQITQISRGCSG